MKQKIVIKRLNIAYTVDDSHQIGDGGEGMIYHINDSQAMKIFHEPENQTVKIGNLEKLFQLNGTNPWPGLAPFATVPEYLATDTGGKTIGYMMQNLRKWVELNTLYVENSGVSLKGVLDIFAKLHQALKAAHDSGFVIGDLNSSNILISALKDDAEVRIIDTDGWGIHRTDLGLSYEPSALHPQVVHSEWLRAKTAGLPTPTFAPRHDWWVFAYHLARCLTKRDPFEQGAFWDAEDSNIMDAEKRRVQGLTAAHRGVHLGDKAVYYAHHLRLGIPLKYILKRWLSCSQEGIFPLELLNATRNEILRCPNCGEEINRRLIMCPFPECGHFL